MDLPSLIALLATVPYVGPFLPYIPLVCGLAAIADAALPPTPAGSSWVGARKVLHVLAINVGSARNAVPAGAIPASVAEKAAEVRTVAVAVENAAGELAQRADGKAEAAIVITLVLLMGLALSACTASRRQTAVDDVRLFCATEQGIVALATATGTPVLAQGQSKAYFDVVCRRAGSVASPPPGAPVTAGTIGAS